MNIDEKCEQYTLAKEVIEQGIYPYFRKINGELDTEVDIDNNKTLMFGSNSYLALTTHPKVKEAAKKAIDKYGTGCAGSRFLNGTLDIHLELEEKLADFVGKESALLFPTGYQTNLGVISTLLNHRDFCVMDKLNHSSLLAGALQSKSKILRYSHNNIDDVEKMLRKTNPEKSVLLVTDGVFSMDGDYADLVSISKLKKKYKFHFMVDEAHSLGVFGDNGNGLTNYLKVNGSVDLIMGTFSKSLASIGGFIAGSETLIHYIKHNCTSFIFSASMPPASVASVLAAIDVLETEPDRIKKLWSNTKYMYDELLRLGFKTSRGETPILPIIVGKAEVAFKLCMMLQKDGVFVNPAIPPAVEPNKSIIRLSLMSSHTFEQIDIALEKIASNAKKLGII